MYYDRSVAETLIEVLKSGGPLHWLIDHVMSPMGRAHHAHLTLRRAAGSRRLGSVQLYWGRTSPLEVQARRGARVQMSAHGTYRALSPELFVGAHEVDALGALEGALSAHLERSAALLADTHARRSALIEGEAVCHAGLMFRYGHGFQAGDPLLAVDAEARVGYPSRVAQHEADRALIEALHLGPTEAIPKKLDTLALSERGDILLVEVKDEAGDIRRAVTQAAAHVVRFRALLDRDLGETLGRMLAQRRRAGLLPGRGPELRSRPKVIPWVAAPDRHDGWATRWSDETAELRHRWRELLGDLRWVRLTDQGDVIEVTRP